MKRHFNILFSFFCLFASTSTMAQTGEDPAVTDTTKVEKVIVDHSNQVEGFIENDEQIRYLKGDVELRQGNIFMSCDTAILYVDRNDLIAYGQVLIQQGDTIAIYADSLVYQGDTKIADLFDNVVLVNNNKQLFTDKLTYDLSTKVATYYTGAMLTSDSTQLRSRRGYYYVNEDLAYFKDTVYVVDPEFSLVCDTLKFNTKSQVATFLGPTRIEQNESKIYCESGFYNTSTRDAKLYDNAQYVKGEQQATADTIRYNGALKEVILQGNARFRENDKRATADQIRYDEKTDITYLEGNAVYDSESQHVTSDTLAFDQKTEQYVTSGRSIIVDEGQVLYADEVEYNSETGMGFAEGNVIWVDTVENTTIVCEEAFYNKETDYIKASGGRPLLITEIDSDSMWLTSDTLVSMRKSAEDSLRMVLAYHDVRIFKSDLQAVCDSMTYSTADSLFRFYDDPLIWSDTSQFYADTIHIQLANNKIDRIYMYNNSFIINSPDQLFFNQIKGKLITAFFKENDLQRMKVEGNAETIYYLLDDEDAYLGVNKAICSEMMIYFGENKIENIRYFNNPKGSLTPMQRADHSQFKLPGFRWDEARRPKSLEDLFTVKKTQTGIK